MDRQDERTIEHGEQGTAGDEMSKWSRGTTTWVKGGESYRRALLGWQSELLRFVSNRLGQQADFNDALLQCRDWKDASQLQQEWITNFARDWIEESGHLVRRSMAFGRDFSESARSEGEVVAGQVHSAQRTGARHGRAAAQSRPRRRQRRK